MYKLHYDLPQNKTAQVRSQDIRYSIANREKHNIIFKINVFLSLFIYTYIIFIT